MESRNSGEIGPFLWKMCTYEVSVKQRQAPPGYHSVQLLYVYISYCRSNLTDPNVHISLSSSEWLSNLPANTFELIKHLRWIDNRINEIQYVYNWSFWGPHLLFMAYLNSSSILCWQEIKITQTLTVSTAKTCQVRSHQISILLCPIKDPLLKFLRQIQFIPSKTLAIV